MYIILVAIMKTVAYVPAYNELLQMSVQYTYYRFGLPHIFPREYMNLFLKKNIPSVSRE